MSSILSSYAPDNSACGWCSSSNDAPNGSEDWLNCGLSGDGWNPPHLTLDKLIYKSLSGDGVFAPCQDYFWAFEQFGAQYGGGSRRRVLT